MAYNVVHHSFMTDSVATLLHAVIEYHCAKSNNDSNVAIPTLENSNPELFSCSLDNDNIIVLQNLLEDTQSLSEFYRRQYTAFSNVVTDGDSDLFYLLVKYDFVNVKALEEYPVIKYSEQEQVPDSIVFWNHCRECRYGLGRHSIRIYEPICQYKYLEKLKNFPCVSGRRLRIAIWGLESIVYRDDLKVPIHNKVLCLKTLYEFISEPYITSAEISDIVQHIGGGENASESVVKTFREIFEKYYPESKQDYHPRSLKHLICCQVRQNLRSVGNFPHGVEELHLPGPLKSCIVPRKPSVVPGEVIQSLKFENMLPPRILPPQRIPLPRDETDDLFREINLLMDRIRLWRY